MYLLKKSNQNKVTYKDTEKYFKMTIPKYLL